MINASIMRYVCKCYVVSAVYIEIVYHQFRQMTVTQRGKPKYKVWLPFRDLHHFTVEKFRSLYGSSAILTSSFPYESCV